MMGVAMASVGPYVNHLHLTPDRYHRRDLYSAPRPSRRNGFCRV